MKSNFIQYANGRQIQIRLETDRIKELLCRLGNPQDKLRFIHVAGTNGKGSVCCFLESIFKYSNKKTGKYTSPELIDVYERISVDGKKISASDSNRVLKKVESFANDMTNFPSPYEIWIAASFLYFLEANCDIVILETGMGGIGDATNAINAPLASVITRISHDHMTYLGKTIEEIAQKKAGIIKYNTNGITVTSSQEKTVYEIILAAAQMNKNMLLTISEPNIKSPDGAHEIFDYKQLRNIKCGICGYHQIENACVAAETALALGIEEHSIITGIEKAKNPARFEIIDNSLIFDGAHNPSGMEALAASLKRYFPDKTPSFIMAFMADKDISSSLLNLSLKYTGAYVTAVPVPENPRAISPEQLAKKAKACGFRADFAKDIKTALNNSSSNDLTVVCGSLYLYKSFKEALA